MHTTKGREASIVYIERRWIYEV